MGKKYIVNKTRIKLKSYQLEPVLMSTCVTFRGDIIAETIERQMYLKIVVNLFHLIQKNY